MKSIANQYRDLKEGKLSQFNFMRNLRMMMPQHITNVTSFNDAIRILKNKSIINENLDPKQDEDEELAAMIKKMEQEKEGEEAIMSQFDPYEEGLNEAKKKKEAKAELHPNQIHPQELRMGIKVELEHTDDLDKAKKIALDHLAENPFYYTALKLSGIESPSAPKVKAPVEKKAKKKKEAVELVDKVNQMQKVKMPKALQEAQFNPLPGEEPNEVVKKAMQYVDGPNANPTLKALSNKIQFQQSRFRPDEAMLKYDYWDILPEEAIEKLELQFDVEADSDIMDDQLPINYYRLKLKPSANKGLGASLETGASKASKMDAFKESLRKMVREALAEMQSNQQETDEIAMAIDETFDGRDNVTDVAGHQLDEMDGSQEIEKKINTGEIDPKKVKDAAEKAMKGDSTDLALLMALGK